MDWREESGQKGYPKESTLKLGPKGKVKSGKKSIPRHSYK